ncbi:MAG: beta-galactosidase trimerization domain-containing protein [Planctomycetes bacterium]|nr:beta-galactosidase trimerization domain-containing protein [Planctomycetota bacterium]
MTSLAGADEWDDLLDEACWIWRDKDVTFGLRRDVDHTFSKAIEITGEVASATLRVTAEQVYVLQVNGKEVGADKDFLTLETYDIKPFLGPGKNQFVVKARTSSWHGGLFAACVIELGGEKSLRIITDGTWDCELEGHVRKAEPVVRGINGGFWNNCNRLMEMPDAFTRLNTELVTPGIPWAKSYAGGRIKVLTFQPRVSQRDTVELVHRSDMDVAAVFTDFYANETESAPFFPNTKGLRRQDFASAATDALKGTPDVIILGPVHSGVFYEAMADRIKELVRKGTGLIYTSLPARMVQRQGEERPTPDSSFEKELRATPMIDLPASLRSGTPFQALPCFGITDKDKDGDFRKVMMLFQYGKGRVAHLGFANDWGLFANASDPNDLHYEYIMSFAIKTILWAAGNEPAVHFKDFPAVVAVNRDAQSSEELVFGLLGGPKNATVSLAIRSPEKLFKVPTVPVAHPGVHQGETLLRPVHEAKISTTAGESVRFVLPHLPEGTYFADVVVMDGQKKLNWAAAALKVTSRLTLAEVKLEPPVIDVADGKTAQLKATVKLSQGAPANTTLHFALLDNFDRLLAAREIKLIPSAEQAEVVFTIRAFRTTLGKVRAELRVGGDPVAIAVGRFSAIRRDWDRFFLFCWRYDRRDHAGNLYARVLASLGFDAGRGMVVSFDSLEVADAVALPVYNGTPRDALDLDPKRMEIVRDLTRKMMESQLRFDPVAYTTGDEIDYGGGDALPFRILDFRQALQKKYAAIEALNRQWDSDFASFDEICPIGATDAPGVPKEKLPTLQQFVEKANQTRNYSRTVDQWLNNYRAFMDQNRIPRRIIKEFDPYARVGVDCPMWPFSTSGHDWFTHMQEFEMFAPYGREGETQPYEEARSFARPGSFLGLEYGGYLYNAFVRREQLTDVEWHRWRVWHGLFRGFTSIWWYNLTPPGNESSLSPGFVPYPTLAAASEEVRRVRQGYDHLFTRSKRDYGPIAVHASLPSRLCCPLMPDMGYERPFNLHMLLKILRDFAGYPYTIVDSSQIARGGLRGYQVLLMPTSLAVGEAEAAELKKFLEAGGILIADARPGIVDENGRWNPEGTLSKLFGISHRKELGRKWVVAEVSGEYKGVPFQNSSLKLPVDPAVELKTATALLTVEGAPLVTVHDVGAGTALCLNIPFNSYRGYPTPDHLYRYLGDPDHHRLIGNILSALFKAHKIGRPVQVTEPAGWLAGLDTPCHTDGDAQYISFTKERVDKKENRVEVSFRSPRPGHCYDSFEGKYLGEGQAWRTEIEPGGVKVFSLFPYRVEELDVRLKGKTRRRGESVEGRVRVRTSRGKPERHFIHLEVFRPDGQAVGYLARTFETDRGKASFSIPLAFNEMTGEYSLVFTDVATRVSVTTRMNLE